MQTLSESSSQANFATPDAARASLAYARRFTARFQEVEHLPASAREAEMLRIQFPAIFQDLQPGDWFVGRIRYPCVGFGPEACGLGYYFDFGGVNQWLASGKAGLGETAEWQELMSFWATRVTQARTRAAYPESLTARLPIDDWCGESGVGFPLYRLAGTVLDYGKLLLLGLDGISAEIETMRSGSSFRESCQSAIGTFRSTLDHYATQCRSAGQLEMEGILLAIRHEPPRTFRQAIQLFWLWALQSGSWNYGRLDVVLGPYLARDIDTGTITEASAQEMVCSLWTLIHGYSNQYNNRVFIGGKGRPDEAAADRFALMAIEATRRGRLNQPQLSLRFYAGQNPGLWDRALDAIGEGCTFPMLYNDDVNIPAVEKAFGVCPEMAAQYTPFGCGEYTLSHFGVGTPSGVVNLLKGLEVALHGGKDPFTGRTVVEGIPEVSDLECFEDLWQAYTRVVDPHVEALALQQKIEYEVAGREASFLYLSMLTSDCLEKGRPLLEGGVRYLGGTLETYGNTNTADSLHVIDELVYRRREVSLPALVAALDANFDGHDDLRSKCLAVRKYGNDEATADAMAQRVHRHICLKALSRAKLAGLDSYLVVIINNWANTVLGKNSGASADGRLSGQPMANANNPAPGADISGATAFLNSLVKLDSSIHAGTVQNMKFTKDWFGSLRPKFDALLRAYFDAGGTQAMITVVSRDDLEAAMDEPEKWGHLMVRVGGFSIRFVELPREAQLEVLGRTLH